MDDLTDRAPNPDHPITPGKSWEVRPNLLSIGDVTLELALRVETGLRRAGYRCSVGYGEGPLGGMAITGTVIVDAESPGSAADTVIAAVAEQCRQAGIDVGDLQEAVVVPAWRDERAW